MCGINLIIDKKGILDSEPIKKMNLATDHRGPDHNHFIEINNSVYKIYLGNNRLKIIDLDNRANQPMTSICGRYYLIYNGEIYNFYELKNSLIEQGIKFNTHSDTEVLLNLLILKGKKALTDLQGMFAFAFYDQEQDKLLLGRDRHGMKPLFYHFNEHQFIVSSETQSIIASGLVKKELNENQVYYYLQYKFAKSPETFFKGIYTLLPGNFLEYQNHLISIKSYLQNSSADPLQETIDIEEIPKKTEDLLIDAISSHLISDVPTALFLSGGVDSTLILALIKKAGIPIIPSFSIVSSQKEKSFGTQDYIYAKRAADLYGSYHYEILLEPGILERFDDFIFNMDQPVGDSAGFLTYVISENAKKKVGVILSGAGADEVFGGYNRHIAFHKYLQYHSKIISFLPALKKFSKILPTGFEHPFRKNFQLFNKFLLNLDKNPEVTYDNFLSFPAFKKAYDLTWNTKESNDAAFIEFYLKEALKHDRKNYLVSDILCINDQMSMQHSLEMRMPYLDDNLTTFIDALPAKILFSNGRKWILNAILAKNGGAEFVNRPKEGFGLPFGNWLKIPESSKILSKFINKKNKIFQFIDIDLVINMLNKHKRSGKDFTLELWSILVLSAWLEKEFGE